ncbi:MAG: DUF2090 domain-containing protein [Hyphomicrobiaceae bacterium]
MRHQAGGLRLLSIDHGPHDLVPVARESRADPARLPAFKRLVVKAATRVRDAAGGRASYGMFLDRVLGPAALADAAAAGLWLACQYPHGTAEPPDSELAALPREAVVKVIANGRADARTPLVERLSEIEAVVAACRRQARAVLIEALPGTGESTAEIICWLRTHGLDAAWWLVEAQPSVQEWADVGEAAGRDAGLIVIARDHSPCEAFAVARHSELVAGFVGGRAVFGDTLRTWLVGDMDDELAVTALAERFTAMSALWDGVGQHDGAIP